MAEMGRMNCIHKRSKSFPATNKFEEDNLERSERVKLDKGRLKNSIPKPTMEIIKEIAVLEYEVSRLERYLLSLYQKAFDQKKSYSSPLRNNYQTSKSPSITPRGKYLETCRVDISLQTNSWQDVNACFKNEEQNGLLDSGVQHCHSSVTRTCPTEIFGKSLRACYSQPPSMMEYAQTNSSNLISLAEHLGTRISDHVLETPNKLSEDMVKCMSTIYCKLAESPLTNHGLSSPTSSSSSMNSFSPKRHPDMMWGPGFRTDSRLFDVQLDNPFHVQGVNEFSGPYSTMVEVRCLYKDNQRLGEITHLLQHFRSLVSRLEEVNPKKLNHEEKLAFWINIHNALVMHAILAYGIPQNNMKRVFLLLKAAYNVGGHIVSAYVIQSMILGCRMSRPGQWIRLLLSSRTKLKAGDNRQAYAIDHPEPLLHFALCSGCHSDPAARVYTPKRVCQELETAKEEFIMATFSLGKDQIILLPKILHSFGKDSGLCEAGIIEMIQIYLPDKFKKSLKKHQLLKSRKKIEWVPQDFAFRYLISKDLVNSAINGA
ncbi:unnamed protein product [Lactuca virosa]|uniref:DUF547 domain-containing protein n=1 Tax=Lactuca virosa TaxID=75947 RepID=A0AAU9MXY2_9ASTR|nr:unnamed protein product [Lactuca virosa]